MKRRNFLKKASVSCAGVVASSAIGSCNLSTSEKSIVFSNLKQVTRPIVIATWRVAKATEKAWEILQNNGTALDAVEQGCRVEEADVKNQSVGKGGLPDRDGNVTLDACIMDKFGNYGAVTAVQNITHVISVARKVMEETPHVILTGEGAKKFALSKGFKEEDLLTESSKKAWLKWKETSLYKPIINIENHDTIGMLAIDKKGDISGACTTSGLSYKMAGRVGDSAIIGSGLFIDNEIGGATATGMGEEVLKTVGSFLIVELMRQGKSPQKACEEAVKRVVKKSGERYKNFQVGFIALNKAGETGAYCIHEWFNYQVYAKGENKNYKSNYYNKPKN
ncbi:N(4)-(beta-N-acetylglucosaminyl)-L-asparaginase [uncultured Polaribacter sp.]|uniref:N(4)-(beta-N-acetylglucosaminyl)-L-asparaginase n=1 Tax=uncultured Polaribacter sp. TaxID=174711 RepID=UPI0026162858|nr:N(4)-(beta-N-acetylglucosaminyl)-L-asparaginase [uncultured Polaribacter sp.]